MVMGNINEQMRRGAEQALARLERALGTAQDMLLIEQMLLDLNYQGMPPTEYTAQKRRITGFERTVYELGRQVSQAQRNLAG